MGGLWDGCHGHCYGRHWGGCYGRCYGNSTGRVRKCHYGCCIRKRCCKSARLLVPGSSNRPAPFAHRLGRAPLSTLVERNAFGVRASAYECVLSASGAASTYKCVQRVMKSSVRAPEVAGREAQKTVQRVRSRLQCSSGFFILGFRLAG